MRKAYTFYLLLVCAVCLLMIVMSLIYNGCVFGEVCAEAIR